MSRKNWEDVSLYCTTADGIITWTVEQELKDSLGGSRYVCHAMRCSKYAEQGCTSYGITAECKSIIKQAKEIAKENFIEVWNI